MYTCKSVELNEEEKKEKTLSSRMIFGLQSAEVVSLLRE